MGGQGKAALLAALIALGAAGQAEAKTQVYEFTGASQTWTVPKGISSATFDLYGAQGEEANPLSFAGLGGRATAKLKVKAGAKITINVGGKGTNGAGGFNGGGDGQIFMGSGASGGGGASDIRIGGIALTDRVLVAGGGGGMGGCGNPPAEWNAGGSGGGLEGGSPVDICGNPLRPGGGGTQTAGGRADPPATPGTFGQGGNWASGGTGGGGGGGWYGGGGGRSVGGGGGGSGHGPQGTTFETGIRSGNGAITISWDPKCGHLRKKLRAQRSKSQPNEANIADSQRRIKKLGC